MVNTNYRSGYRPLLISFIDQTFRYVNLIQGGLCQIRSADGLRRPRQGHKHQLPQRCPTDTRSDTMAHRTGYSTRRELLGARWGLLSDCIGPHRAQSVEVTRLPWLTALF